MVCLVSGELASPDRTHDGFYLGARFGLGKLRVTLGDSEVSGRSLPLEISAGVALERHIVLYGEYYDARTDNVSSTSAISQLAMKGFGAGVKYYLMPFNLFASTSVLASQLSFANGTPADGRYGTDLTTKWGFTGRLSVGKEWWVSSDLGLGLAGEILLGRMGRREGDASAEASTYTAKAVSLLVSTSYN